jgi:hypothetical protein
MLEPCEERVPVSRRQLLERCGEMGRLEHRVALDPAPPFGSEHERKATLVPGVPQAAQEAAPLEVLPLGCGDDDEGRTT